MEYRIRMEGHEDRVYEGFGSVEAPGRVEVLAVAVFDGDRDLYRVDPNKLEVARREITRMYEDDYQRGPSTLTLFRRVD